MKGYIHVYTGNGKGKTTAALGLALRATGAGKKVFIAQFVKGQQYAEIKALASYLPSIPVKQYGLDCFIYKQPTQADIDAARKGLNEVKHIIQEGGCDMLILDEANIAVYYNLFSVDELLDVLGLKPEGMEVIVTGRYAHDKLIAYADLVTEMREVKHYYTKGVKARLGIEC